MTVVNQKLYDKHMTRFWSSHLLLRARQRSYRTGEVQKDFKTQLVNTGNIDLQAHELFYSLLQPS